MIAHYLYYRSKGIGRIKAIQMAWGAITYLERILCACVLLIVAMEALLHTQRAEYQSQYVVIVSQLKKHQAESQAKKYEMVILACLNREPIKIDGRSMDCGVRNFKEAVDI
jgi:hypothetical protein